MSVSVEQYHRENVVDFDLDEEESKEFQKLSLNDVPNNQEESKDFADFDVVEEAESKEFQKLSLNDVPQVPNSGKPAGDFLYHDISKCLAPDTFSSYLLYLQNRPEVELILDDEPKQNSPTPSTYSPLNPPDWLDKWDYKVPSFEDYVRLKSIFEPGPMSSVIPQK